MEEKDLGGTSLTGVDGVSVLVPTDSASHAARSAIRTAFRRHISARFSMERKRAEEEYAMDALVAATVVQHEARFKLHYGYHVASLRHYIESILEERMQYWERLNQPTPCKWTVDSDEYNGDSWDGACGGKWCFTEGDPNDNEYRFCPNCGRPIKIIIPAVEEETDGNHGAEHDPVTPSVGAATQKNSSEGR